MFYLLLTLLLLAALVGSLLGWISFNRLKRLQRRLDRLEGSLAVSAGVTQTPTTRRVVPVPTDTSSIAKEPANAPPAVAVDTPAMAKEPVKSPHPVPGEVGDAPDLASRWMMQLQEHWMIWLGGLCVALAGVFLVKYSIDQSLLGPTARIVLAVLIGTSLHGTAEWLRRRTRESHPAFAALAGGASITLYAAILAALHLYQLLEPGSAFLWLAAIALATMALSLVHGPVLAIIGLLGAYVVPVLVSIDGGVILATMIYSLIISGAALLLMRWVYRPWLWLGVLAGGLGWWLMSLLSTDAEGFRGMYLAILAYGMLAITTGDWLLAGASCDADQGSELSLAGYMTRLSPLTLSLVLLTLAQAGSIVAESFTNDAILRWSPLVVVLLLASRDRPSIAFLPWLSLVSQWFAWLYCAMTLEGSGLQLRELPLAMQDDFLVFAAVMTALYSGVTLWQARSRGFSHLRSSLWTMAPVCWLALAYLLVTDLSTIWQWSLVTLALGLIYIGISQRELNKASHRGNAMWLILGGHVAYSLALAMLFREATLTLALATQLISLAWLIRKFELPALDWLVKAVLALIVTRLTFNPWLLSYPVDVHWSLWTYGGSTICCAIAARLVPPGRNLRLWLEAAALHLFVLFVVAETRYWLYDGEIFVCDYSLTEAAINTALWGLLGMVYYYRASVSEIIGPFHLILSRMLMVMACVNYVIALTILNPLWGWEGEVAATPVFNLLLLAYGVPPLIALLAYHFYDPRFRRSAGRLAAAGLLFFISLEIRHLWQGALNIRRHVTDGELYTYSVVWMLLAIAAILYAARRQQEDPYKGGMVLLLVVMAKVFLIDMSGLEGLWRVASFMGLGLALLALAYLYQRISPVYD